MEEYKKAFVLMPFKEPYNSYYAAIYKPALEAASYSVTRADDLYTPRPIMLDIQQSISEANLILCDMSERNPNVFYELGLAHALGKPAILVARKEDDIPFDLRHVRIVIFDYVLPGWEEKLKQNILAAARTVNETTKVWPPPLIVAEDESIQLLEKLLHKIELEKKVALQEAEIKRIKMQSDVDQQEMYQKIEQQNRELEKARVDLQFRQDRMQRALDAVTRAFSSSYPKDPREVEIISQLLHELSQSTSDS